MAERPLTEDQLQILRDELERELGKLERSMRVTDEALEPVALDQTTVGRLSRMDALQNQGLTKKLREREQVRLGALIGALKRFEAGSYGICASCGSGIPFERLSVMPEAASCSACG